MWRGEAAGCVSWGRWRRADISKCSRCSGACEISDKNLNFQFLLKSPQIPPHALTGSRSLQGEALGRCPACGVCRSAWGDVGAGDGMATVGFGEEVSSVGREGQIKDDGKVQARMSLRRVQPQARRPHDGDRREPGSPGKGHGPHHASSSWEWPKQTSVSHTSAVA